MQELFHKHFPKIQNSSSTCALVNNGGTTEAKCWGNNWNGMIADGKYLIGDEPSDMGASLPVIDLGLDSGSPLKAKDVAVADSFMCVLTTVGKIKCMGNSGWGTLGNGGASYYGDDPNETIALQTPVILPRPAIKLAAMASNACAVLDDFSVYCWGHSALAGQETSASQYYTPVPVNFGTNAKAIDIKMAHSVACVLISNGTIKCWGANVGGMAGNMTTWGTHLGDQPGEMGDNLPAMDFGVTSGSIPYTVKNFDMSPKAGSTGTFGCAVLHNGDVKCWGDNLFGSLGANYSSRWVGVDPYLTIASIAPPAFGKTAIKVGVGSNHTCVIFNDLTMKCFGSNADGQLGLGTNASPNLNIAIPDVNLGGLGALDVNGCANYQWGGTTCVVLTNGTLKCYGQNAYAQLGNGSLTYFGIQAGETVNNAPAVNLGW